MGRVLRVSAVRVLATLLLALPVLFSGLAITPPSSVRADDLAGQISTSKQRQQQLLQSVQQQKDLLAQLQSDEGLAQAALDSSKTQLDSINVDQSTLSAQIATATDALSRVQARRDSLVAQLHQLDWTLQLLEGQIAQGEEDLAASKRLLGEHMAQAYRTGQTSLLEQILSTGSFADVLTGVDSYLSMGDQDAALAASIQSGQADLDSLRRLTVATRYNTDQLRLATDEAERELAIQQAALQTSQSRLTALEDQTAALHQAQTTAWNKINADQAAAALKIKQQQQAADALDAHIADLVAAAQKKAAEAKRRRERHHRNNNGGGGGGQTGGGNGPLSWPVSGYITQEYGCTGFVWEPPRGNCAHFHTGIDIANAAGTPIHAAASGLVAFVGWNPYDVSGDPAFIVLLSNPGGITTEYVHLEDRYASGIHAGAQVSRGQVIGYMGDTGNSTGVHLHFETHLNGQLVDPRSLL